MRPSSHICSDAPAESTSPMPATSVSDSSGTPMAAQAWATAPRPMPALRLTSMWVWNSRWNIGFHRPRRAASSAGDKVFRSGRAATSASTSARSASSDARSLAPRTSPTSQAPARALHSSLTSNGRASLS